MGGFWWPISKIDVFLARFLEGYLNIGGAASGAATGAAGGVLSAADAPGERRARGLF